MGQEPGDVGIGPEAGIHPQQRTLAFGTTQREDPLQLTNQRWQRRRTHLRTGEEVRHDYFAVVDGGDAPELPPGCVFFPGKYPFSLPSAAALASNAVRSTSRWSQSWVKAWV
jgi:hypothetical protein